MHLHGGGGVKYAIGDWQPAIWGYIKVAPSRRMCVHHARACSLHSAHVRARVLSLSAHKCARTQAAATMRASVSRVFVCFYIYYAPLTYMRMTGVFYFYFYSPGTQWRNPTLTDLHPTCAQLLVQQKLLREQLWNAHGHGWLLQWSQSDEVGS